MIPTRAELLTELQSLVECETNFLPDVIEDDHYEPIDMSGMDNFNDRELLRFVRDRLVSLNNQQKLILYRLRAENVKLRLAGTKLGLEKTLRNS